MKYYLLILFLITFSACTNPTDSANNDHIPQEGLVAYYPFNNNAKDESKYINNATVHGASLTSDRFSFENKAYHFDGIDDYLLIPNESQINYDTTDFTISLWFYPDTVPDWQAKILCKNGENRQLMFQYLGTSYGNKSQYMCIDYQGGGLEIWSEYKFEEKNWSHILFSRLVDTIYVYCNGILSNKKTISHSQNIGGNNDMYIGCRESFINYFAGKIDDIFIYNRALLNNEIETLFNVN